MVRVKIGKEARALGIVICVVGILGMLAEVLLSSADWLIFILFLVILLCGIFMTKEGARLDL